MLELEDRIRTEVTRQAEGYVPADDLPARIEARVRHRRVVRRTTVGVAAAAVVVAAVVTVGVLTRPTEDATVADDRTSSTTTSDGSTTTSTVPDATTSTTEGTASTSTPAGPDDTTPVAPPSVDPPEPEVPAGPPVTEGPAGPPVTEGMPLHRQGVGGIVAGMTLREAAEATGNTITPDEPIGPDSTCGTARIAGTRFALMVDRDPTGDPMDAVIQVVGAGTATIEGIAIGDTEADVIARYGEPTRRVGSTYPVVLRTLVYEQGGVAYQFVIGVDESVATIRSGYPRIYVEGCA